LILWKIRTRIRLLSGIRVKTFVVKGKSKEEVTRLALEHVRACHADEFNLTNTPEEIGQMERALSRSTHIVTD
jgi:hypothetical protein